MLSIENMRNRFNKNPVKFTEELKKYNIEELYDILDNIRKVHEKNIIKKVGKEKIIYKIRDYMMFIEREVKDI